MWAVVILQICIHASIAWDPDAGLVTPYTAAPTASVTASSNADTADLTVDGDDQTHWTSFGCLPTFYYKNSETNVLLNACLGSGLCTTSNIDASPSLGVVTDGDTGTNVNLKAASGATQSPVLNIRLPTPQKLQYFNIKAKFGSGTTSLKLYNQGTLVHTFSFTTADDYNGSPRQVPVDQTISNIAMEFESTLTLYELSAIGQDGCVESVTWDLGTSKDVGVVKTRHWAGGEGLKTQMFTSTDGTSWTHMVDLDPDAMGMVTTVFPSPVTVRYVKITHQHSFKDYVKVYMWELAAYDGNGEFGPAPVQKPNPTNLRRMLGVNGIWGWGNDKSSTTLPPGQGPFLYAPVASHGRNYHNMEWDVSDPDLSADYDTMAAGGGTQNKPWVNWDTEYAVWLRANLTLHVSLQFTSAMFPPQVWDTPDISARRYGEEFAKHFGPSQGNGLATAAEVGNEPWDYDAAFYNNILLHMAMGLKAGDSQLLVLSGAFQADNENDQNNYIGTRVTENIAPYLDVVNFHHYSFLTKSDGIRITTYPEHPASAFNTLKNMLRWRDANMPTKPVWVTEWGWDAPGAGQNCQFSECVSETAAAVYATRGLLIHARYGVQRSTWFFYANTECDHRVFCRCGLTGNIDVNFGKKKPYLALQGILGVMGQVGFLKILQEDQQAFVYAFGYEEQSTGNNIITHVVAWRPVDIQTDTGTATVSFGLTATPLEAYCQDDSGFSLCSSRLPSAPIGNVMSLDITPSPIVVRVQESLIDSVIVG